MSLEAAVTANTEALVKLTEAVLASNASRAAAVETLAGAAAATPPKAGRGRPPKADTPAPAAAPKAMTVDEFRAGVGAFMDTTDEAVRQERRTFVKAILDHFGVKAVVEIPADNYEKVLGWTAAFLKGEKVNFSEGEDAQVDEPAGEEEDDLMG